MKNYKPPKKVDPTIDQMRRVLNENFEQLKATAETGYRTLGRGCLLIEFAYLDSEWSMAVLYKERAKLREAGCPEALMPELDRVVATYEPDVEVPMIFFKVGSPLNWGLLDFYPKPTGT